MPSYKERWDKLQTGERRRLAIMECAFCSKEHMKMVIYPRKTLWITDRKIYLFLKEAAENKWDELDMYFRHCPYDK